MLTLNVHKWPFVEFRKDASRSETLGWMFLSSNIIFSATYNIFAKLLSEALSPLSLLFFSEALTIFFTLFFFGALPVVRQILHLPRRQLAPMLTIGLTNGILGPILWFSGLHNTSAVNASLFGNAEMMFMMFMAVIILKEEWTLTHFISTMSIVLGIATICLHGFTDGLTLATGDALLLLASLSFATGSIVFRKFLHKTDPQLVVFMRSAVPVASFFLFAPFFPSPILPDLSHLSLILIGALVAFGLISRFLNTFTFYEAIDRLPVASVSLFSNLTMIVAIGLANAILGEHIYFYHILGGGLIILGTFLLELRGVHANEEQLESHLTERKTSRG